MANVLVLCRQATRSGAHGHTFYSALKSGKQYKMLSKEREEDGCDSDDGAGITVMDGEAKRKAVFEVGGVPLHYNREVGNIMSRILSQEAAHDNVCK